MYIAEPETDPSRRVWKKWHSHGKKLSSTCWVLGKKGTCRFWDSGKGHKGWIVGAISEYDCFDRALILPVAIVKIAVGDTGCVLLLGTSL